MRRSTDRLTLLALLAGLLLGGAAPAARPADGHASRTPSTDLVGAVPDAPAALHPSLGARAVAPRMEIGRSGGPGGGAFTPPSAFSRVASPSGARTTVAAERLERDRGFRAAQALARAGLSRWATGRPPPVRPA